MLAAWKYSLRSCSLKYEYNFCQKQKHSSRFQNRAIIEKFNRYKKKLINIRLFSSLIRNAAVINDQYKYYHFEGGLINVLSVCAEIRNFTFVSRPRRNLRRLNGIYFLVNMKRFR